jgi:hydrogenase maturation protease
MAHVLIIGYGNPLRGDDGFGWQAALRMSREQLGEGVHVLALHQLTPEMAERISRADRVIFLDASLRLAPGEIGVEELEPADLTTALFTHHLNPVTLIACARTLYQASVSATVISVGAAALGYQEELSPQVAATIPEVIERVRELARSAVPVAVRTRLPETAWKD